MERIKVATRETGKTCNCKDQGRIVETYAIKYGKSNGIMGPGHFTPSSVQLTATGCEKCGRTYHFPDLIPYMDRALGNKDELQFELSLYIATLTRAIEPTDLPDKLRYVKKKRKSLGYSLEPKYEKVRTVPAKLKRLVAGTTLYVLPNPNAYQEPNKRHTTVILSKESATPSFEISYACLA